MIPFQFAGIAVCLFFTGWNVRRLLRRQRPRWLSLLGILLGALGAATIFNPTLTTDVARAVGIARGADLLIYLVALAFLGSWFYFYQKIRTLSNAVTVLVRELAIQNARSPSARAGEPADRQDSTLTRPPGDV